MSVHTLIAQRRSQSRSSSRSPRFASITVEELSTARELETWGANSDPFINRGRLARAKRATGEQFDSIVLEVIGEARAPVGAKYLRARAGGPRWKLQASLGRLVEAGSIERSGVTSSMLYRMVEE